MPPTNRQWLLAKRPVGLVKESDFELHEAPVPAPGENEMLVRTTMLAFEPAMRGWIDDAPNYLPPVGIGEVMRGMSVGEVVESNAPGYAPGDLVSGTTGWQEYAISGPGIRKLPEGTDPRVALSVLGMTGLTAWYGLLEIGQPKEGDTVVVSGAAGATGSVAAQIAKIKGCRVIGIAGGPEKCAWLTDKAGLDGAVDYKNEDVGERLSLLCPDGIDVFFDNVGGEILDAVLARIARGARLVICGSISRYNDEAPSPGPSNYFMLTKQRARMEGFVILDHFGRAAEAAGDLLGWVQEGRIASEFDVQHGFENIPKTLLRLFAGENLGKQLLAL